MKASILLILFLSLFPQSLLADPAEEAGVELSIRVFPIRRRPIRNLFYRNPEGEFEELRFRSRLRSNPYLYEGPPRISFYRPGPEPDPETGLPVYNEITSITVTQREGDILIFFMEPREPLNGQPEEEWRLVAIDDHPEAFPKGHMRVFNATGVELDGYVGSNVMSLGFEISPPFPIGSDSGGARSDSVLFAIDLGDAGHQMVYANRLEIPESSRSILVLRPPRRRRSIRIDSFLLEDSPQEKEDEDEDEEEESP